MFLAFPGSIFNVAERKIKPYFCRGASLRGSQPDSLKAEANLKMIAKPLIKKRLISEAF